MASGKIAQVCQTLKIQKAEKQVTLHNSDEVVKWVSKRGIIARVMAGATSLLLLSHTPVSRKVFQFFHCHKLGDREFLRADYAIECYGPGWFKFFPLVLVVLGSFTLALPGSIAVFLFKNRHKLYSAAIAQKVGWLYRPYVKGAEFWQVHDVVLKMILTGMLIYIPPSFRATIAAMITIISIANLHYFKPHKNKTLFLLCQASFIVTCFKYLTALMIGAAGTNHPQEGLFGYLLVTLDIIFFAIAFFAIVATIIIIRGKIKKMSSVKKRVKGAMHRSLIMGLGKSNISFTKVTPSALPVVLNVPYTPHTKKKTNENIDNDTGLPVKKNKPKLVRKPTNTPTEEWL